MRLLAALQLSLLCLACSIFRCNSVVTEESILESVVELSSHNLTSNLEEWESDIAIMFYAPWCKYCKQLLPSWGTIAALSESNRNLVVGKFDCEASEKSGEICKDLDVDRYPSLFFLGYGNFNQAMGGAVVGRSMPPRLVRYVADLYPEAIYDWVSMLSFLSSTHRRWDDVVGFFTGKTSAQKQLANMHVRVSEAEQRAHLFGQELEMYKVRGVD
jgi:thiol-disulfide isomerase/thioredoxin